MESRFGRHVLRGGTLLRHVARAMMIGWLLWSAPHVAAQNDHEDHRHDDVLGEVISPDIERRKIDEAKIDSEWLEVGLFAGVLSVEDFGSNDVYGARFAVHVTEDIFLEANLGISTLQETSYEMLSGDIQLLTDDERDLQYYNLNVGVNLFPGEIYLGNWAFKNNFYLIGGAGNTHFASNDHFSYLFGGGFRLFVTDWLGFHVDFRNHVMEHSIFGEDKKIQNLESHLGFTLFL